MNNNILFSVLVFCSITWSIETIEELDDIALFSFAIMSDNLGNSPIAGTWDAQGKTDMTRVNNWISTHDEFVLGLGDHVIGGETNSFLDFIQNDSYWSTNFYPNIADHDNELFGSGEGDWGAGTKLFDYVDNFVDRPNVQFRSSDKVDYYAFFEVGEITIHVISLHYSDTPSNDPFAAFPEKSRAFMQSKLEELAAIKTDNDIIIVLAHDRGNFVTNANLTTARIDLLFNTADLICDASSHIFHRHNNFDSDYPEGAIWFNSGAATQGGSTHGYVNLHVLTNPTRITLQYINVEQKDSRQLHVGPITKMESFIDQADVVPYIKEINGPHYDADWSALKAPVGIINTHTFQKDDITVSSFGTTREIEFFTSERSMVVLSLYNSKGRFIKNVYSKLTTAGTHITIFDTTPYNSGIYYIQGFAGQNKLVKKLVIMN